jgi:hypothetical protein
MANEHVDNVDRSELRGAHNALGLTLGIGLIAMGVLILLGRLFGIRVSRFLWPLIILGPGVLAYLVALALKSPAGEIVCIPASIVTMLGALLFYQNLVDHWESWAYAWALIAPTSIGLGYMLFGILKHRPDKVHIGRGLATVGGVIFLVGFIFFELLLNISGFGLGRWAWPILLLALGVLLVLRALGRNTA